MSPSRKDLSAQTIWTTQPNGPLAAELASLGVNVLPLEGDEGSIERYVLGERAAVERRTGTTFLRGIQDKTLFTSAIHLRERYEIAALIVEGQIDHERTGFHPQAIRGALSSMLVGYGLTVLTTPDVHETAALLAMAARQVQTGIPEISLNQKRKAYDLADLQRRVVEMLPGCGVSVARDLLQIFGSIEAIASAPQSALRRVPGIGAKRAKQIYQVLHATYRSVDTERNLEDAIEAAPELLFGSRYSPERFVLLARQHLVHSENRDRHVVDLVFVDQATNELLLVELKRDRLVADHELRLQSYLDHAHRSALLHAVLEGGAKLRGILATIDAASASQPYVPLNPTISAQVIDREATIDVLNRLRQQRQSAAGRDSGR